MVPASPRWAILPLLLLASPLPHSTHALNTPPASLLPGNLTTNPYHSGDGAVYGIPSGQVIQLSVSYSPIAQTWISSITLVAIQIINQHTGPTLYSAQPILWLKQFPNISTLPLSLDTSLIAVNPPYAFEMDFIYTEVDTTNPTITWSNTFSGPIFVIFPPSAASSQTTSSTATPAPSAATSSLIGNSTSTGSNSSTPAPTSASNSSASLSSITSAPSVTPTDSTVSTVPPSTILILNPSSPAKSQSLSTLRHPDHSLLVLVASFLLLGLLL
ncbi:uncharacterized protein BJ171DRAFT_491332 [Polychytrium aggregatum]|uniref:uncharacterized protein n=1 Tax=Polychytrium aggregatum TaxID=110093 RepID=UPI0022FF275E|nr:uncharacterized protein BJ171DRAFT_518620 [Polychytrium aggregatum]XP_052969816.1 uncharacterized protein BJ171DRAFT_491332 [Polychytrium aggregatum]KAI9199521.1 hypothetical protein BJ171DRAFT_518620 [Polychytrium aggregatum]KAI9207736.1 hypothetical protein BJ171DRAFT_491332 [Polychytrium aggregatum]